MKKISKSRIERIKQLTKQGLSRKIIAERLNVGLWVVRKYADSDNA